MKTEFGHTLTALAGEQGRLEDENPARSLPAGTLDFRPRKGAGEICRFSPAPLSTSYTAPSFFTKMVLQ
jgi:hypothetical protein